MAAQDTEFPGLDELVSQYNTFKPHQLEPNYHAEWDRARQLVRTGDAVNAFKSLRSVAAMAFSAGLQLEALGLRVSALKAFEAVVTALSLATSEAEKAIAAQPELEWRLPFGDIEGLSSSAHSKVQHLAQKLPNRQGCLGVIMLAGLGAGAVTIWSVCV